MRKAVLIALGFLTGAAHADPVDDILANAAAECAGFENGAFDAGDAVIDVDLDGEEPSDRIVDTSRFSCSSMSSFFCGSGGCTLYPVVGDRSWEFQAEGWRMIEWDGRPILLIARDRGCRWKLCRTKARKTTTRLSLRIFSAVKGPFGPEIVASGSERGLSGARPGPNLL